MPAIGAWVAGTLMGLTGTTAAVVGGLVNAAIGITINLALSKINAPEGPRPSQLTTENRSSNAKRVRHLGRVRTSGTVVFYDWANVTVGSERERRLYKLIAIADGGMTNVIRWYLNNEPVAVDADGYVTTAPWPKGRVRLRFRTGIPGNADIDGGLWGEMQTSFPGYWTTDHRMRSIGTVLAQFDATEQDEISEVYPGGDPEVSVLIDGAPAYWAPSDDYVNSRNPARQLCDVLVHPTYGVLKNSDLNIGTFAQARDVCLDDVPTAGGTRPRYQSGISFAMSDPMKDTAQKLLDAMGARAWIDLDGKLSIEPGIWVPPTVTIEERHIHEMEYSAGTPRISRVTALVPSYVAPEVRWQETTADVWEDNAAVNLWGEGEAKGIDLLAVQHHGQARHLCKQKIAKMNPRRRFKLKLGMFGLRLLGERKAYIHIPRIGVNNSPFWIESYSFDGQNVAVDLIQADGSSFAWTAGEEGQPPTDAEDVNRETVGYGTEITSLTVVTGDGGPYIRVQGTFYATFGYIGFMQYRRTGTTEWTDGIRETTSGSQSFRYRTVPLQDGGTYQVRTYVTSPVQSWKQRSTPVVVTDIDVIGNNVAPDPPVVLSQTGVAGGTLSVTFAPDLGVNYDRTGLYRAAAGGAWEDAIFIKWIWDKSTDVTATAPIPAAGARFFLRSFNASDQGSTAVVVGNYPA